MRKLRAWQQEHSRKLCEKFRSIEARALMSDECYPPPKPQPSPKVRKLHGRLWYRCQLPYFTCYVISFPGGKLWMLHIYLVVYLPLWKMMEFVSWDDDIPIHYGNIIHMFQTTKQNRIIHPRDNIKYQLGYHRIIRLSDIIVWISNWDIIGLLRGIPSGNVLQFAVENHKSF